MMSSVCYDEQDYAWVKQGMIFPFIDNVDRCVIDSFVVLVFVWFRTCA